MILIIRTYRRSGRIQWWVMNEFRFPLATGSANSRRQAFCLARSAADQLQAERREWVEELKNESANTDNPLT